MSKSKQAIVPPDFNKPILIYISKKHCGACDKFKPEWTKLKRMIMTTGNVNPDDIVRVVHFEVPSFDDPIWSTLTGLRNWTPTFLLIGPKSYFSVFTPDDKFNTTDYVKGYKLKGFRYNSVMQNGEYTYTHRPDTADNIYEWIKIMSPKISSVDETKVPSLYLK
jgi:hypothetical protein